MACTPDPRGWLDHQLRIRSDSHARGEAATPHPHPTTTRIPRELDVPPEPGAYFRVEPDGYVLILAEARPGPAQIVACELAPWELALSVESPLIVLLYRPGTWTTWRHVPYAWPVADRTGRTREVVLARWSHDRRARLRLFLTEAATGNIAAARTLTLDPAFSRALHEAIATQARTPWDGHAYLRAVSNLALGGIDPGQLIERAEAHTVAGH